MRRAIDKPSLRLLLAPADDDARVVEVTKLAILALLDAGQDVSRNALRAAARSVVTASGRKAGIAKSTLDRNEICRRLFEAATAHVALTPPRPTSSVDAHVARMGRAALQALIHAYRQRSADRRTALDLAAAKLAALGKPFDTSSLVPLVAARDKLRACRQRRSGKVVKRSGTRSRRSVSLVRRSIARLRSAGGVPSRKAIVDGTAQFNNGVAISDATIDRNRDCAKLVDEATGRKGSRLPPPPNDLRHRDLADGVMAERSVWRETRRLAFLATRLLAQHEDAEHRAEATRRADAHYASLQDRDRIISVSSAATTRAAPIRDSVPASTA